MHQTRDAMYAGPRGETVYRNDHRLWQRDGGAATKQGWYRTAQDAMRGVKRVKWLRRPLPLAAVVRRELDPAKTRRTYYVSSREGTIYPIGRSGWTRYRDGKRVGDYTTLASAKRGAVRTKRPKKSKTRGSAKDEIRRVGLFAHRIRSLVRANQNHPHRSGDRIPIRVIYDHYQRRYESMPWRIFGGRLITAAKHRRGIELDHIPLRDHSPVPIPLQRASAIVWDGESVQLVSLGPLPG